MFTYKFFLAAMAVTRLLKPWALPRRYQCPLIGETAYA